LFQVVLQAVLDRGRERRDPVLGAFAIAHGDLVPLEVDILHAQREGLQPQAGAVQQTADQKRRPLEVRKDGPDLVAGEHDRQAMWTLGAHHRVDAAEAPAKDAPVEKHESIQGLVLRRGADVLFHRKVAQERPDLFGAHLLRVADSVVEDESPDPVDVRLSVRGL
jgi:hypothetical protein